MDSSPGDPLQQARQFLAAGQHDKAWEILRALLEISSTDAETNALMGAALSMGGKLTESLPYLERAVGLDPQKASYFFNLGAVAERTGDSQRALSCYRRAVELDPNYKKAAEGLQRLYTPPVAPPPATSGPPSAFPSAGYGAQPRTDLAGNPVDDPPPVPASPSIPVQPIAHSGPYPPPPSPYGAPLPYEPGRPGPYAGSYLPGYPVGDWNYAPQSVKSARTVDFFLGILGSLAGIVNILVGIGAMSTSSNVNADTIGNLIGGIIVFPLAVAHICIGIALKKGSKNLWTAQMVLSLISLIGMCGCGTLLHLIVLSGWFKDDTKAWFGAI